MLRTLAETYPGSFWFKLQTSARDELFFLLRFLLERIYLKDYNACFAENFYGLKRVKFIPKSGQWTPSTSGPQPLSSADKAMSLMITLLFPYVRGKIRDKYNAYAEQQRNGRDAGTSAGASSRDGSMAGNPHRVSLREALHRGFMALWPFCESSYEMLNLVFQLLFMFGRSKFYGPLFYLQGVYFARLDHDDYKAQREASDALEKNGGIIAKATARAFTAFRLLLISSALVFKLVEWYYSPENRAQREASQAKPTTMTSIPPPLPPQPLPSARLLAKDQDKCPVCANKRTNPAVASSGVVYCYACIHDHVSVNGTCPVTGIKCSIQQIRRIYQA